MAERDPLQALAGDTEDLYDVATWEPRTTLDRVATGIHWLLVLGTKTVVVGVALLVLLGIGGLSALTDPQIGALTAFSILPAFGLAVYVWYSDTARAEPLTPLLVTFLLGILTASFAAIVNSLLGPRFRTFGAVGTVLLFYVVVGPVEETVKLLAVRLYAYSQETFDCVIDGAVYGAMAGLGFATIENSIYITQQVGNVGMGLSVPALIGAGGGITAIRALAGPGHVIYSAVSGYYLGLAKFNRENRGPIVIKGLLLAAFIHATYNATVGLGSTLVATALGVPPLFGFIGYVVVYDGFWALFLIQKVRRYSSTYHRLRAARGASPSRSTGSGSPEATAARTVVSFLAARPAFGYSPTEIHEATGVARERVDRTLSLLERRGLVERESDHWSIVEDHPLLSGSDTGTSTAAAEGAAEPATGNGVDRNTDARWGDDRLDGGTDEDT